MSTVRDQFWKLAAELGMTTVFGNPGSTEMTYLADFPSHLRYVLGLQEGAVTSMADGFTQVTGGPVLVNLHTAPGIGNAMGALLTARDSRAPLIMTAGNQVRAMQTSRQWLTNDEPTLLPKPAVKFAFEPPRPQDVPAALARAVHLAMSPPRGPVFLSLPMDDYDQSADDDQTADLAARSLSLRAAPDPSALREVSEALAAASNPVLVLGLSADALGGRDDAIALARRQNLPVWAAPSSGRSVFPSDSPLFAGYLPFGYQLINDALAGHDLVLVVGAAVFTTYPDVPGRVVAKGTRLIQISEDPDELARAPLGDALLGDPALALAALRRAAEDAPATSRPMPPGRAPAATPQRAAAGQPVTPAELFATIGPALPARLRLTNESPSNLADFHAHMPVNFAPGGYLNSPNGGLGYGLPAAVGAAIADPRTPVLATIGDGSLQYTGQALWTAAQQGADVVTIVMRNDAYDILKAYSVFEKVDKVPGLDLPGLDPVAYAAAYGVPGQRVDGGADAVRDAVLEALKAGGPHLVEVPIDPTVPPLI